MTWNHRIVKTLGIYGEEELEIREVYYDSYGEPYAHGSANIFGNSIHELHEVRERIASAFLKNVLDYPEDFTGDPNRPPRDEDAE